MKFENVDEVLTSKLWDFKKAEEYWRAASCLQHIHKIITPTLFINSVDDPVVGTKCIDFDVFRQNPNVAIATTKYGGHIGYSETFYN